MGWTWGPVVSCCDDGDEWTFAFCKNREVSNSWIFVPFSRKPAYHQVSHGCGS